MNTEDLKRDILLEPKLVKLCLDDGHVFVSSEGQINTIKKTKKDKSPKEEDIRTLLSENPEFMDRTYFGKPIDFRVISHEQLEIAQKVMSNFMKSESQANSDSIDSEVKFKLNSLLQAGVEHGASDIHIRVYREDTEFLLRVDGRRQVLKEFSDGTSALNQSNTLGEKIASYLFNIGGNKDFTRNQPLDDSYKTDLEYGGQNVAVEYRVSSIPIERGVKIVLRCLTPLGQKLSKLDELNLPKVYVEELRKAVSMRSGAIILSGPMGSGKTTTTAALINEIDVIERCVHALEDPVEIEQANVSKTRVDESTQIKVNDTIIRPNYAYYAKSLLRQDTDCEIYGEIRAHDDSKAFLRKASTGGLAFATIHTNSALDIPGTFIEQFNLSPSLVATRGLLKVLIHQRLVQKLCNCAFRLKSKQEYNAAWGQYKAHSNDALFNKKIKAIEDLFDQEDHSARIKNLDGCDDCFNGEAGRQLVMEVIVIDNDDRQFIKNNDSFGWEKHLKSKGWLTIQDYTVAMVRKGIFDIETAIRSVDDLIKVPAESIYKRIKKEIEKETP